MFELAKQTNSLKLLHWTKELPSASAGDPLGLSLRVSARLANELLYCITSITPRARYYAFFPWAFQDYNDHEYATPADRGRVKAVLSRERAMVLGAVIHHNGPCKGGGLGGSDEAEILLNKGKRASYDLASWSHLNASEGQFGAAYKGSLINLGLFKTDAADVADEADDQTRELSDEAQAVEVRELSPLGKRLAKAFGNSIRNTCYVKENWTLRNKVDAKVLEEFGAVAGLCELSNKNAADREVLRNVFFSRYDEMKTPAQQRRRMSLLFLLECIAHANAAGTSLTSDTFRDICYFDALLGGEKKPRVIAVAIDARLKDIAQRWRIYHAHSFLAVALQSFLVTCVRTFRERRGGLGEDDFLLSLSAGAIRGQFRDMTGVDLTENFFALTPRQTLPACGMFWSKQAPTTLASPRIENPLCERALETLLIKSEANDSAGIAFAALLLYQVLLRYPAMTAEPIQNWYRQQVYDPYADVSLTVVGDFVQGEFGSDWIDHPNGELLKRVIWRFVIRQHQTMSYERGFGGTAPLFQVDGSTVIGTSVDYTDPRSTHPRFNRALQILEDLGLIEDDSEVGYWITDDGKNWLRDELSQGILS